VGAISGCVRVVEMTQVRYIRGQSWKCCELSVNHRQLHFHYSLSCQGTPRNPCRRSWTVRARWYMSDGAPAYSVRAVRGVLNNSYHYGWICKGGPTLLHVWRHIWIWNITCADICEPLCMHLLLTVKRHFTTALWMPVRLPATTPASLNVRWDV
jgi:hypothetical protein